MRRARPGAFRSLLVAALSAAASLLSAQTPEAPAREGRYAFRTYAEEEGLGNLTIECLLQDRTGFLWVGTQDGLFRFDGARFLRFGREDGLDSTRVNSLHETEDGRLYVGTRSGLARRAGDRFVMLGKAAGLPESSIPDQGIASRQATVLVATAVGLFAGTGDAFRLLPRAGGGKEEPVTALEATKDGALLFARGATLLRRTGAAEEDFGGARGLPGGETIDQLRTDAEGTLWVRTLRRLYRLRRGEQLFADVSEGLPDAVASGRLASDDEGRLLVPTQRGLARVAYGGEGWTILGRERGLESDTVLSALVDREGSLWVGLAGAGLSQQLGLGIFTSWGSPEGLPHDVVWSIVRETRSSLSLWVGTQEGVARFDTDGTVATFREGEGLGGNTVYALAATEDGSVWAGSWPGGVTRFGPERGRRRRYAASDLPLSDFRVASLFVDKDGAVWAGARSGLYRLDPASGSSVFEKMPSAPGGEDPDSVFAIARDESGTLFAAGRFGLQVFGEGEPLRLRRAQGLKSDFLASIALEPGGGIVAGYRESLGAERVSLEGGTLRLRPLDRSSGLTADKVILLGRDASGALWIGSGSGVDVWPASDPAPTHYGRSSGLISEDLDQNAFFAEPDGTVWLGTSRGLVRYRADAGAAVVPPPPILLTQAAAGERRLDLAAPGPSRLSRQERNVRFAWAGLTFLDPHKLKYRYRLVGLDDAATETSAAEARFPALPAGRYRFEVSALSATGGESERPATFSFEIAPAWWERLWARGAAALLLGLAVLAVVRLRTRALEADRRRLEEAVADRSAELAAANRELEEASTTDPLTRLRNRRYFAMVIEEDARRALRAYRGGGGFPAIAPDHRDLIFYFLDLDHFKSVNDRWGHDVGDRVLIEVAARLRGIARQSDLVIRWGGEEVLLVSRDAERKNAGVLARRLIEVVAGEPYDTGDGDSLRLTASVGWAVFPWDTGFPGATAHPDVLRVADRALYAAKSAGRNRAVGALPSDPDAPGAERSGLLAYRFVTIVGPAAAPRA